MASPYRISTRTHPRRIARVPTATIRAKLRDAARTSLEHQHADCGTSICIVYSVDSYLRQLNRQFSGVDAVTDLLAFPSEEDDRHIGDVIISMQQAVKTAQRAGHGTLDELQLLTVHGALHLLGHKHNTEEERLSMWQAQTEILQTLGLSISTSIVDNSE